MAVFACSSSNLLAGLGSCDLRWIDAEHDDEELAAGDPPKSGSSLSCVGAPSAAQKLAIPASISSPPWPWEFAECRSEPSACIAFSARLRASVWIALLIRRASAHSTASAVIGALSDTDSIERPDVTLVRG